MPEHHHMLDWADRYIIFAIYETRGTSPESSASAVGFHFGPRVGPGPRTLGICLHERGKHILQKFFETW